MALHPSGQDSQPSSDGVGGPFPRTHRFLDNVLVAWLRQHRVLAAGLGLLLFVLWVTGAGAWAVRAACSRVDCSPHGTDHAETAARASSPTPIVAAPSLDPPSQTASSVTTAASPSRFAIIRRPAPARDGRRYATGSQPIEGEHRNLPADSDLWALIRREDSELRFRNGPMQVDGDGRFHGRVFLGSGATDDVGREFTATVALVPRAVSLSWWSDYTIIVRNGGHYLPPLDLTTLRALGVEFLTTETFVLVEPPARTPSPSPVRPATPPTPQQ